MRNICLFLTNTFADVNVTMPIQRESLVFVTDSRKVCSWVAYTGDSDLHNF